MTHLYPKSNKGTLFSFNFPRRAKHQLSSERGHCKIQPTDTGLPHGALPGRASAMAWAKKPIILDKSPWDSTAIFIFFLSYLGSLLKQCILFKIFLQFSLPPPYTKLKLGKNYGYTRPKLFVG